ncbi:MAG: murein biosynthesis integral membrane protein MurJ [Deferrisomatales bacterium]|nr:murein biosynthesis integral membrane protein MurJ [Deferrisomatales bacterium]
MAETENPVTSGAQAETGRIARAVGILSGATALSRVLGFLRDVITASYFGAGGAMDAFLVAFRLPNMLRSLFAEGSLTVAFVPVFVETLETRGRSRADELGRICFTLLGVVLLAVSVAGVLGAPLLVRALAWGFTQEPDKLELTVSLTRVVFPYIGLVGLTALAGGMLNSLGDFASPALAPVVLNLAMIAAVVGLSPFTSPPVRSAAYGVVVGGVLQLWLQWRSLRLRGFSFRFAWDWRDAAVRRILRLLGPRVFGVGVYQVNIFVSTVIATWLPDGSVSYLYYAERLFQLPLGVFAVAAGTAALPSLSRLAARNDLPGLRETLGETLRLTGFIVVPAAAGLLVLAHPILAVLLERGSFTPEMTRATSQALAFYALALIPVAGVKVVAPAYYALNDMRTPVWAAFWALLLNAAASLLLMRPMGHAGLALASALSNGFNLAYLLWHLRGRAGPLPYRRLAGSFLRMGAAAAVMAAVVGVPALWVPWRGDSLVVAGALGGLVAAGAGTYLGAAHLLGLGDASRVVGVLGRRLRR